jgi:hypothetical protein
MTTRTRKTPTRTAVAVPAGVTITSELLRAADLHADEGTVQRYFDIKHANRLEAKWDWLMVGTLMVSRRADGSCWIIDGNHRCKVALRVDPDAMLRCEVYEGLTLQQEAQMFLHYNEGRKNVPAYDSFLVELTAGDDIALRMQSQVHSRGLELDRSGGPRKVAAVQKCRQIVEMDKAGTGLLSECLMICEAAWGRSTESWDGQVLLGIAKFLTHWRGESKRIDRDRLARRIGTELVFQWKAKAQNELKHSGGSSSRSNPFIRLLAEKYDSGLKKPENRLLG